MTAFCGPGPLCGDGHFNAVPNSDLEPPDSGQRCAVGVMISSEDRLSSSPTAMRCYTTADIEKERILLIGFLSHFPCHSQSLLPLNLLTSAVDEDGRFLER